MQSENDQNPPDTDLSPLDSYDPLLSDTVEMNALPIFPTETSQPDIPKCYKAALSHGDAIWLTMKSPAKFTENEDSVTAFPISNERGLLVVADGLGGHRGGKEASKTVVRGLRREFSAVRNQSRDQKQIEISGGLKIP
ncbi:MAG: hypothetical protein HON04_13395, partial [Planctomicrobium sp.]|nr:hypothetical protein [Planctomicrobium sp.]